MEYNWEKKISGLIDSSKEKLKNKIKTGDDLWNHIIKKVFLIFRRYKTKNKIIVKTKTFFSSFINVISIS